MFSASRNSVSSSSVVGKEAELHRAHQVQRDHHHHHGHQDVGDDQQVQNEAGQGSDEGHHDGQHRQRHGHLAERRPAAAAGQPVRRGRRRHGLWLASCAYPGNLPFISLKM